MATVSLKPGTVIGNRYRVECLLGRGGIGAVYLSRDQAEEGTRVAVKLLTSRKPAGPELESLREEFSILSRLRHPNLVRILDFGILDDVDVPYLVEEYVEGVDLSNATASWTSREILRLMVVLCRVVQFLHARGVVHGDIKSSNALLGAHETLAENLRVLDYGLAVWREGARRSSEPATLAYTAPEVLLGKKAGPRSDLYSIGVLFYQLLARRLPFEDEDTGFLIQKQLQGLVDMRPIERLEGGGGLAQLLRALLEKDPARRPSSAEDAIRLMSVASGEDFTGVTGATLESYFSAGRFVGRERETAYLRERAGQVRENGRGKTIFITGESGSGKSRSMEELKVWALLEGWRVVEGSCRAGEERSYRVYREVLARTEGFEAEAQASQPGSTLFRLEENARVLSFPSFEPSMETAAGQFRDHLTREIVRRLSGKPTILMLHDFHWADEATTVVLDYLTSDVQAHPILVCVSVRSAEAEQGPIGRLIENSVRQLRAECLVLEPLPEEAVRGLIASMTGEAVLGDSVSHWVWQASGGNPFFIEEILKHLVDRGFLHREDGRWKLEEGAIGRLEVPTSVAVVLRQRLEQLPEKAMELASWLAVINRSIKVVDLQLILAWHSMELEQGLAALITRQMIRREGKENKECVEFRHALISEVIRADLGLRERRRMHLRIGEALEHEYGVEGHVQELAVHFTEGDAGQKAVRYALEAAAQCRAVFANDTALHLLEYVLKKKEGLSREELCQAAIDAADACCALGIPARAIPLLVGELRRIRVRDSNDIRAGLYMQLSRCFQFSGDNKRSERAALSGLRTLRRSVSLKKNTRIEASLLRQLASTLLARRYPRKGLSILDTALRIATESVDRSTTGHLHVSKSAMCFVTSNFGEGVKASKLAIEILSPLNALGLLPTAYSHLAINLAGLGKFALALQKHEIAVEIGRKGRSPLLQAQSICNLAECYCRCGDFDKAASLSRDLLAFASETNNRNVEFAANLTLLEIEINRGDYNNAVRISAALNSNPLPSLPSYVRAQALYLSAWLCLELGNVSRSFAYLTKLNRLHSGGFADYEVALGEILWSRIHLQRGKNHQALSLLEQLEARVIVKKWAYVICLTNIWYSEAAAASGNVQSALRHARRALRLARAMPASHLEAHARLLIGRSYQSLPEGPDFNPAVTKQGVPQEEARSQFERVVDIATRSGSMAMLWRAHYELARLGDSINDAGLSASNAKTALECLRAMEKLVPNDTLEYFSENPDTVTSKKVCEDLISRHGRKPRDSDPIAVMQDEQLRILFNVSNMISSIRDLEVLLGSIVEQITKAMDMKRVLLFLRDRSNGQLTLANGLKAKDDIRDQTDTISKSLLRDVNLNGVPFISADMGIDPRVPELEYAISSKPGTVLCAPLKAGGRVLGVLYADHPNPAGSLSESTIGLFAAFCNLSAVAIDNALAHKYLMEEKAELELHLRDVLEGCQEIVGQSAAIQQLRVRIADAASSPLDVLISGESGTGKELVARAIHRMGRRSAGRFVTADCGSFAESLIESEFFGSRKGAFTGSMETRAGLFETANGGVLFLDEISNLSLKLQAKLLRVLEEREIRRIGEMVPRKIDVQVIAATNRDLLQEIDNRKFRKDLYYRLNAMEIRLPALRERLEDVPSLAEWFLAKTVAQEGKPKRFAPEALGLLSGYSYPGNVRELKNIVLRSYYTVKESIVRPEDLPQEVWAKGSEHDTGADESKAREIYRMIRKGEGSFLDSVKQPFMQRQYGKTVVRQIIRRSLVDSMGNYRLAFRLLRIPQAHYAATIQFLKRNGCYLDFRPFRKK